MFDHFPTPALSSSIARASNRVGGCAQTIPMTDSAVRRGPVLTTAKAAEYVGLRPQTLRVMKVTGEGPKSYKHGRLNVYYPADLDAWLHSRLVEN